MVRFANRYGLRGAYAGTTLRRGQIFGWATIMLVANAHSATASCITTCVLLTVGGCDC